MTRVWRSLRVQLAVVGFFVVYVPVLLLLGVTAITEDVTVTVDGVEVDAETSSGRSPWTVVTAVALTPVAAGLAWWQAGRAVRPMTRVRLVAEEIEASDLHRRIDLSTGPTEIVALAASFDGMLARLERAVDEQQLLIEATSHALRTPISVLTTNAEVLLTHPEPTLEMYRTGLQRSASAAARLQLAVEELLVTARGRARALERRPADLVAIARTVADEARESAALRDVSVTVTGPGTAACAVDEPTVRRALANLVDNAVRHAPPASTVEVDVIETEHDVAVAVTDHGPGIPEAERARVVDRGRRDPSDRTGRGLGLPIARHVAEAHGGTLTLRSPGPAGDGCVVELRFRR